jgi:hypothetical protein
MPIILAYAADILMILASFGAAIYCWVLSRRLSRLTSFDTGIGGAIAVLSAQVDDMKSALSEAKAGSDGAGSHLNDLVRQARDISGELELMIAACHDFAEEALVMQGGGGARRDTAPDPVPVTGVPDTETGPAMPIFGSRRAPAHDPASGPAPGIVFRSAAAVGDRG